MADFRQVKARVSIMEAAKMLNLTLHKEKNQFRGVCPACNSPDPRKLAITPDRGIFYCFDAKKGGSCIDLVMHITGLDMAEAGEFLLRSEEPFADATAPRNSSSTTPPEPEGQLKPPPPAHSAAVPAQKKGQEPFDPNTYASKLTYTDEVAALGLSEADAARLQIGYSSSGFHRGAVVVPLRWPDGTIAGFISAQEWKFPKALVPPKVVPMVRKQSA